MAAESRNIKSFVISQDGVILLELPKHQNWQHEDTGYICRLPVGTIPGERWYPIEPIEQDTKPDA